MKKLLYLFFAGLILSGCATFSIRNQSHEDALEGADYRLVVQARDKDADTLSVTFLYRINGGSWIEEPGIYNGNYYDASVSGDKLSAGILEYYAWFINSKGERVQSNPVRITILTFEQAKRKKEDAYRASVSNVTEATEFYFNSNAVFSLLIRGAVPDLVDCRINTSETARITSSSSGSITVFNAEIPYPHTSLWYSCQWLLTWNDSEFGPIQIRYPEAPLEVPLVDRETARSRIQKDIRECLVIDQPVSGSYLDAPLVTARLQYTPLLKHFSLGQIEINLDLKQGVYSRVISLDAGDNGLFTARIPVADLEKGADRFTITLKDRFDEFGRMESSLPSSGFYAIEYKDLAALRSEALKAMDKAWTHQAPDTVISGEEATIVLMKNAAYPSSVAVMEYRSPSSSQVLRMSGLDAGNSWFFSLPPSLTKQRWIQYRFLVEVNDSRLGKLSSIVTDSSGHDFIITPAAKMEEEILN